MPVVRPQQRGGPKQRAPTRHAVRLVELRATTASLALAEEFGIARGSRTTQSVVQVELEHDGVVGRGEAAPVYYRGESIESARDFLTTAAPPLVGDDPLALEDVEERLRGLSPPAPPTSYPLTLAGVAGPRARARRARGFRALKVKVGAADDLERLEAVRAESNARLSVDANEGWSLESARRLMPELIRLDVEFVEQPFPAGDIDSFTALSELQPRLPVIVDESCQDLADVAPAAAYADGINVKLAKSGGVREAVRMIHAARALGLRVMLGCMVESQLGVAPAAAIASLADWVDLDGHLLLSDQPFTGLRFEDGRVLPSFEAGLGVAPA